MNVCVGTGNNTVVDCMGGSRWTKSSKTLFAFEALGNKWPQFFFRRRIVRKTLVISNYKLLLLRTSPRGGSNFRQKETKTSYQSKGYNKFMHCLMSIVGDILEHIKDIKFFIYLIKFLKLLWSIGCLLQFLYILWIFGGNL